MASSEERVSGIVSALADSGVADIYNRVLCPTCIVQIIFINTMLVGIELGPIFLNWKKFPLSTLLYVYMQN